MSNGFSFQPGASVLWRGKRCIIVEAVTASSVLLDVGDGQDKEVVPVSKLRPIRDAETVQADRSLDALVPEDLAEVKRRFTIIKPLVRCERRREADVLRIAEENGVCRTTIYDWIKLYEGRRRVSDLAPRRKGRKMPKRLSPEAEAIITSVIDEKYLSTQKASGEEVILEIHRRCRAAKLETKPCACTIRTRLRAVDPKLKVLRREGKKAAHDKFGAVKGNFPGADAPLSVVQIDHTLLDIMVLDEEMRLPIGRPWLTLAIDVFSRMVVGYHLSLDNPGAFAVGLCLCHGMLDKAAELERLGVKGEWPVWGKPRMIHSDNGKDFRSYLIQDTLDEHDNGGLFELLVAAAYRRAGAVVDFIPERKGVARTPDMHVRMDGKVWAVECKRMETGVYGERERAAMRQLWGPHAQWLADRGMSVFCNAVFEVEIASVPSDYLAEKVVRWLRGRGRPLVWNDTVGSGTIGELDLAPLRAELAHSDIQSSGSRVYELLSGSYVRTTNYVSIMRHQPASWNPRYMDDCDLAVLLRWESRSEAAIDAKARDILKKLSEANDQLPEDLPGVVHVGFEAVEGDAVERARYRKILATAQSFDPGVKPLEYVYCHYFVPESPPDQSWAYDETTQWCAIRAKGGKPLDDMFLVIPPASGTHFRPHWES